MSWAVPGGEGIGRSVEASPQVCLPTLLAGDNCFLENYLWQPGDPKEQEGSMGATVLCCAEVDMGPGPEQNQMSTQTIRERKEKTLGGARATEVFQESGTDHTTTWYKKELRTSCGDQRSS